MRSHILNIGLFTGLTFSAMATFAEPPVQAGETLDSLSKVKVTTTVNGQPGSLNELLANGQIKVIPGAEVKTEATTPASQASPADASQQIPLVTEPATQAPLLEEAQPNPAVN